MTDAARDRVRERRRREKAPDDASFFFWRHELAVIRSLAAEARPLLPFLGILTLLAAATRLYGLGDAGLWMDEISMLGEAATGTYRSVSYEAHFIHLEMVERMIALFGENEYGMRMWSTLLGTATIPVIALWGLWSAGPRVAIALGVLALVSPWMVMYAQDGNYYAGMTFYTMLGLLGYTLLFRGAPHIGFVLALLAAWLNRGNHPMSAIFSAVMLGGMVTGLLVFRDLRRLVLSSRPSSFLGRPALPLLAVLAIVVLPSVPDRARALGEFLENAITPGQTALTNVEFGFPLFARHFTAFTVNFFRMGTVDYVLAMLFLTLTGCGILWLVKTARAEKSLSAAGVAGLAIVLPLFSYALLFSLNYNRTFYIRYFSFLQPLLLVCVAGGVVFLAGWIARGTPTIRLLAMVLAVPVAVNAVYTGRFLLTPKANYREAADLLEERFDGGAIVGTNRLERIESGYFLETHDLPDRPPGYAVFSHPDEADLFTGALPAAFSTEESLWLLSSWRYVDQRRLYEAAIPGLDLVYRGVSRWDPENDALLLHWDYGDRFVYPNAAARFELGPSDAVLRWGRGTWRGTPGALVEALNAEGETAAARLLPGASGPALLIPELPDTVVYTFRDFINLPEHTRYQVGKLDGREYLRNERDGSYDFLLYQDDRPRFLRLHLPLRDEADPLLEKNAQQIPPGLDLALSVDGRHVGLWRVPPGPQAWTTLEIPLDLEPGNHRLTIHGTVPRLPYTPYFPWGFGGLEWTAGEPENPQPSLEESGEVVFSPGWKDVPRTILPTGAPAPGWTIATKFETRIDNEITAPAGDPPLRIDIPSGSRDNAQVVAPPMPVIPGTLVTYSFYVRYEGLHQHEITPLALFLDSRGTRLGLSTYANGPNIRGQTFGKGWVRRQVVVPVPRTAAFLAGGVIVLPLNDGESDGATLWLGSFSSSGTEAAFADPALPDSFFGFGDDALRNVPAE